MDGLLRVFVVPMDVVCGGVFIRDGLILFNMWTLKSG